MHRQPRQISSETELYDAAVGALARRAYSVHEMRKYLERRAQQPSFAAAVLGRLRGSGLLDDARYARQFARDRARNRRQGSFRIARELRARGVTDRHIEAALEELRSESDEGAMIHRRIESWLRRHGVSDPAQLDRRRAASLYHSLLRAGFSGQSIRDELRRFGHREPALEESEDEGA